jgi:hypothetical protein
VRFSAAAGVHYMFSRRPLPASVPAGVQFVTEAIGAFVERLRARVRWGRRRRRGGSNPHSIIGIITNVQGCGPAPKTSSTLLPEGPYLFGLFANRVYKAAMKFESQ